MNFRKPPPPPFPAPLPLTLTLSLPPYHEFKEAEQVPLESAHSGAIS